MASATLPEPVPATEPESVPLNSPVSWDRSDTAAVVVLVVVALVVALPALRSDMLANTDTPVHLAEIRDLASGGRGWSELGFCGFPLGLLQPPLTFGGMAWLTRLGVPLEAMFELAVVASLVVPALVFYVTARKRVNAGLALALAATLPLYRAYLSGEASALSGMFSFYFAAAALWALAAVLVRPSRTLRDAAVIAGLTGLIGASHMYVTIGLVYLAGVHGLWSLTHREKARRLVYDVPAIALGAVAAACYWLPNLLARTSTLRFPESLGRIAARLLTSSGHDYGVPLGMVRRLTIDPILHVDSALQLATLVLAVISARAAWRAADDLPRYGIMLSVALVSGMILARLTGLPLIGPTGTRLIFVAKMGLLAGCLPFLRRVVSKVPAQRLFVGAAVVALGFSFLMQRVVAQETLAKDDKAMADVRALWAWVREHRDATWGRLYLQDTFGAPIHNALTFSHVLVRTAEMTATEQVGAYYGLTPYDKPWLFLDTFTPAGIASATAAFERANITHLLLINAEQLDLASLRLTPLARFGRLTVVARDGARSRWASVLEGAGAVRTERLAPGTIRITKAGGVGALSLSESYHPFWRADSARLSEDAFGLMRVDPTSRDPGVIELTYSPPSLPYVLSALASATIAGLFVLSLVLRGRRPV